MIEIRDGKLYNGNKVIRPEIGNVKHIKALKEYNEYAQNLKEGVTLNIFKTEDIASIGVKCLCGRIIKRQLFLKDKQTEADFVDVLLAKPILKCNSCLRTYKLYESSFPFEAAIDLKLTFIN